MSQASINFDSLQTIIAHIQQHGTNDTQPQIIAVTKNFSYTSILSALKNNIKCIGENRIQEFLDKKKKLSKHKFESHLIGHLQSNKINKAVNLFDVIQTVDSFKLARKINEQLKKTQQTQKIYIQINVGNDRNKHGLLINNTFIEAEKITQLSQIKLQGVMTILPYLNNVKDTQKLYAKTRAVQEKIKKEININCTQLSMGMSRDYIYALKEGATHIRIGTALYGPRI